MSRIIILNGPIGCGKDTVGIAFGGRESFEVTAFKEPLFRIAATTMNLTYDEFHYNYTSNRAWKDTPNEALNGRTVRELLIHISEVYVKPFMGNDYFGHQSLAYIRERPWQRDFIFTDGGFAAEIDVLASSGHEVVLVHMYRDGCTFEGDSRSYVLTNSVPRIYTLTNNGTVDEAVDALGRILDSYDDNTRRIEDSDTDTDEAAPTLRRASRDPGRRRQVSPTGRAIGSGQDVHALLDRAFTSSQAGWNTIPEHPYAGAAGTIISFDEAQSMSPSVAGSAV